MTDTKDNLTSRVDALDDEQALLSEKYEAQQQQIEAQKQQIAALAQQVAKLMAFAAQMATRVVGVASPIDEQAVLLAARAGERARQVTPPVKFGSTYDGQSDRILGKRKEALGK
jgi:hypothetical protein